MPSELIVLPLPPQPPHQLQVPTSEMEELEVMLSEIRAVARMVNLLQSTLEKRVERYKMHLQRGGQRLA